MATKKNSEYTKNKQDEARSLLRKIMDSEGVNASYIANKLKEKDEYCSDSRTNFLNKLARSSFKFTEILQILDVLGYDIKFIKKDSIEGQEQTEL